MTTYKQAQKIPLKGLEDRRRKVTDEQVQDIKNLYNQKKLPIREIARLYEKTCSRRLIQFIIFPSRLKQMQDKHREEQHWKSFYNRKKLTEAVRNLRNYKYKLNNKKNK